ncbi:hypothetical protein BOX15_Mlig019868g1, partial [Macrostomum lignano]
APDKLLYSQTALWDSQTTESCLLNFNQQPMSTTFTSASTAATSSATLCEPNGDPSGFSSATATATAADSGYMSSSSLHTACMISDLVNKLVDSEDDQMPPPLLPSQQLLEQQQQPMHLQGHQQQPQLQAAIDQRSPRPLVRMQQQQSLQHAVTHQPSQQSLQLQNCVTSASAMHPQQQNWMALQACHMETVQSGRTDAAIKSAGNVTRVPVQQQQQQQSRAHQHPQALVLPSASNYILLSQHPQFLQLAPRPLHPQPQQLAQPSSSLSQSSTGNLVAMETGLAGSPGSRQASMTRRATQTDSERSARLSELTELRRLLGKELRHAEARLSAAWQARRFSGVPAVAPTGASVGAAAAASCGSNSGAQAAGFSPPSSPPPLARQHGAMGGREDRELLAVCQELSRLHQLVQRAERLRNAALPAGVHSALDRLSEAVRKCQTRRKEEVTSLNNRGSSSGGGRAVEERDSRAVSAAVGELLEQLQAARTCLWATLQMAVAGEEVEAEVADCGGDGSAEARAFRRLEAHRLKLAERRADPYED